MSPTEALVHAVDAARRSPCAKSKRGVVVFRPDGGFHFTACNGPPTGFACNGSDACRGSCNKVAVHAEERAIRLAGFHADGAELLHVKVVDGEAVPSGAPSCWQCSRVVVDSGIAAVWLLHEDGLRRYPAAEFHRLTLAACGLPECS